MAYVPVPEQRQPSESSPDEMATLCHDLRQCVTAGLLLTQLPKDNVLDAETKRRLELIHQTLTHAGELLERATVESAPKHWVLDLTELVGDCVRVAEFSHKVRLENEVSEPALVCGDPLLLHRAIDNMIDNAGRAAGESGDIVIRVGGAGDEAWIEVTDDGPGFGRIEHGTGQGLSVITSAVRACDGRLEITSGPGPGTAVRVTFPRQRHADCW
ncbi:MAG TPA: HAMP domain-containing sensor histidine kinase [Nocardioidaceae bacterium]|nr:HAMP domain-containing sensor histidine kinase [Nocardioidaceae bacterium]